MAISVNALASGEAAATGSTVVTPSISPTASRVYIAIFSWREGEAGSAYTMSGWGLTWNEIDRRIINAAGAANDFGIIGFWAVGSPSAGALTFTITGDAPTGGNWSVFELDGADLTSPIVQSADNGNASADTTADVTLAAFADAVNNAAFGAFADLDGSYSWAEGSGFTTIHDVDTASYANILSEWKIGEDTLVDAAHDSFTWAGIAFEVKAASTAITGTIAATITKATASLTGAHEQTGTLAATLTKALFSGSGHMDPKGTIAATLAKALMNATGSHKQSGAIISVLQALTASLTGVQGQGGSIAAELQEPLFNATGTHPYTGTIAAILTKLLMNASGGQEYIGQLAATLQEPTASFTGHMDAAGTLAATLTKALMNASGHMSPEGALIATLQTLTFNGSGALPTTGVLAAILQILTFSGTDIAVERYSVFRVRSASRGIVLSANTGVRPVARARVLPALTGTRPMKRRRVGD